MATGQAAVAGALSAPERPLRVYMALLGGVLCIGFTAIFTKWAGVPGPVAAAFRMTTSAVVLALPFAWHLRRRGGDVLQPVHLLNPCFSA